METIVSIVGAIASIATVVVLLLKFPGDRRAVQRAADADEMTIMQGLQSELRMRLTEMERDLAKSETAQLQLRMDLTSAQGTILDLTRGRTNDRSLITRLQRRVRQLEALILKLGSAVPPEETHEDLDSVTGTSSVDAGV